MGKESKLRHKYQPGENRQQYPNGDRKLYDRNACPSGCDEEVWHLALYFSELAELNEWPVEGMPVVYTELYHRVARDPDLTSIVSPAILGGAGRSTTHTTGTEVVEEMIEYYYNNYYSNKQPSINDFCNYNNFSSIKKTILKKHYIDYISTTGTRKLVKEYPIIANRRTEEEQEVLNITLRNYTQGELNEKLKKFREGT